METVVKKANFAPLGLLGFGMTTILLNLHNSGIMGTRSIVIAAMGIALGGLAQVIAGVLSFKQGNTFGGTAFTAYGFFWLSLVIIWVGLPGFAQASKVEMGYYLTLWGIFTLFMAIGTLKHSTISKMVFWSLTLLFFLLALGDFTNIDVITKIAGVVGIFCGLFAMYDAVGQIVNGELDEKVFPLV